MEHTYLSPATLPPTRGFSQVVLSRGTRLVHISGQAALDTAGQLVGAGNLERQTEQTFENLTRALAAAGATWNDVVMMRIFVVGLKPEHVPIIRGVRQRYVSLDRPPASTLIGVQALVGPDWLIEIEATAVLED